MCTHNGDGVHVPLSSVDVVQHFANVQTPMTVCSQTDKYVNVPMEMGGDMVLAESKQWQIQGRGTPCRCQQGEGPTVHRHRTQP